jgi:hypothetical protein
MVTEVTSSYLFIRRCTSATKQKRIESTFDTSTINEGKRKN